MTRYEALLKIGNMLNDSSITEDSRSNIKLYTSFLLERCKGNEILDLKLSEHINKKFKEVLEMDLTIQYKLGYCFSLILMEYGVYWSSNYLEQQIS